MGKLIIICLLSLFLIGCAKPKPEILYQDVYYRVISCPAPAVIPRPELMINTLTDSDNETPGKVVQYYKTSVLQLQHYIGLLELQLKQYDATSKAYLSTQEEYRNEQKSLENTEKE